MKSSHINLLIAFSLVSGGMNLLFILGRLNPPPSPSEELATVHRATVNQLSECLRINMEFRQGKK